MTHWEPGDIIQWGEDSDPHLHRWIVKGVHYGGIGTESLVHLENVSHKPGWTGEWETHVMMFVPECLLRGCKRAYGNLPSPRPGMTMSKSAFTKFDPRAFLAGRGSLG